MVRLGFFLWIQSISKIKQSRFPWHFFRMVKLLVRSPIVVLEKSELSWEPNFYSRRCIAFRTISLPGFNGLCCKLTEIALFI